MKNYVAIYNTEAMKNVHYAFMAESMEAAIEKAPNLVSGEDIKVFETDDMGQIIYNSTKDVAEALNMKYAGIEDFEATAESDKIVAGGFYKSRYGTEKYTEYFICAIWAKISEFRSTFGELFEHLDNMVQSNLKEQKERDEAYAKAHDRKVEYKYDYSLIEEA